MPPVSQDIGLVETLTALLGTTAPSEPGNKPNSIPAAPMADADRYEHGDELGAGGMGTVYDARDLQFGRRVALKELGEQLSTPEGARRFVCEAVITGNLEHPGVPTVYSRGVQDGRQFYAMRRIEGRTLTKAVTDAQNFEQRLALLPAVVQMAHTLGFAHARGVVHRDIKPDNVLLGAHGEAVVVDWGIAKVLNADLPEVEFVSPSDRNGPTETAQGSILGLLTGHAPFDGQTFMLSLGKAIESKPPPIAHVAKQTPPALREIVERAMAKNPAERYPDAAALASALEDFVAGKLAERPSRLVDGFVTGMTMFGVLTIVGIAFALSSEGPAYGDFGYWGYVLPPFAAAGAALAAVDWRTQGRHRLSSLTLAFALGTVLIGLLATIFALLPVEAPEEDPWQIVAMSLAPLGLASLFGCLQLFLWAIARRAVRQRF